jgi:5-methylcytosine-specific restriction protein A
MSSPLPRPCRNRGCANVVRGKPYCHGCQRQRDRIKRARRPDLDDYRERERRRRVVADHRAIVGDWCPGWGRQPAHQSADLTADHVKEVAKGGDPRGKLVVRCRSCNAARSAHLARQALQVLTRRTTHHPAPAQRDITHAAASSDAPDGPAVA